MTSHPPSVWHHMHYIEHLIQSLCHHTTVLMTSQPLYMKPHSVCRATYTLYMWHHSHSLWYHTTLWHSHTLYSCHHTQDTCHHIHCSWVITYSVLIIEHLQYVWYQTHHMYDIIWILCDIKNTLYDITRLYSSHHIHSIHDITPTIYETTYTLLVTSQPQ